jgi:hypothetical protein
MNRRQRRRAENEVVFKQRNDSVKELAKSVLAAARDDLKLRFTCECANEDCHDWIEMSVSEYELVRGSSREFIIKPGHEQLDIERVVRHNGYNIVEKLEPPPPTGGNLNQT